MIRIPENRRLRGFTLVELVMVIALASVVAVMVSSVLSRPLEGFMAQSRRAELTDMAAIALNRMTRDIRLAVPNSLRQPDANTLELMPIHAAGRYRASPLDSTDPAAVRYDPPRCPASGACFIEVIGPALDSSTVAGARWMVIYNLGAGSVTNPVPGSNLWAHASPGVITPTGAGFAWVDAPVPGLRLSGAGSFAFAYASPQHRFYLAREVIGYRCMNAGESGGNGTGTLRRISAEEQRNPGDYPYAQAAILVGSVSRCRIEYSPATNTRNALVTIELGVRKGGEEVVLLQQVHVDNAP